jgi:hypothetical protein
MTGRHNSPDMRLNLSKFNFLESDDENEPKENNTENKLKDQEVPKQNGQGQNHQNVPVQRDDVGFKETQL